MPRRTQAKAPKDTNAPRRPLSAYMLYNKQRMSALRAEHPGKKITEITKLIGAEWKELTAERKQPFEMEAKENKQKYNSEMAEYKKSDDFINFQQRLKAWKISQKETASDPTNASDDEDEALPVRVKAQRRPKDPNAPKKPLTGFFLFQTHRRPQLKEANPDKKHTELVKIASEEWRSMTTEQKEPFESQSREKREEYKAQLQAYKETEEYKNYQVELAAWKKAKTTAAKKKKQPAKQAPAPPPAESESASDESTLEESVQEPTRPTQRDFSVTSSDDSDTEMNTVPNERSAEGMSASESADDE